MRRLHPSPVRLAVLLSVGCLAASVRAASVGAGGYTNSFNTQPAAADWSTASIGSAAGNITTAAGLDSAVQGMAASGVAAPLTADAADPPAALGTAATWSSSGLYVQTRPTGVDATLLMCTLVNNLGINAASVTISYDFTKVSALAVTEEVDGQRAYYSLTGAAGSWTVIPEFSTATSGRVSATLNVAWPNGGTLYILWADDNGSGTPDTPFQIDNFSAMAVSAVQVPVAITGQPQNQTVGELRPASFSVAATGNPSPTFQWYRGVSAISGATNSTYSIASAALSDNNAQFKVVAANTVSNVNYAATSSVAVLMVTPDTIAPTLLHVLGLPPTSVSVDFSEGIRADTASNIANYSITSLVGNLTISAAVLSANGTNVTLTTSAQTLGTTYTLIVNGIRDVSAASNQIAANSIATFTSVSFVPADIGSPQPLGSVTASGNGYNVTAGGLDIGGTADQFTFDYQSISGDFDVKVRLAGLTLADVWTKAGLMARETLNAGSAFAASLATPSVSGAFFESRASTAAAATLSGNFPVNYPSTWLRLQRAGNTFTGYASLDGSAWMTLGSLNAPLANVLFLGFAVSSHTNNVATTAQFRDYQSAGGGTIGSVSLPVEPAGPCTRKGPIAITEIMCKPAPRTDGQVLDFVELYNSNPYYEDISGYRLSGDIDFTFPSGTVLRGGQFVVIAKNPADVQTVYGIANVMGPYTNNLTTSSTVRLRNKENAILLEVSYFNDPPWPVAADGTGHSLVLARPSYGEGDPQAWAISDQIGGSPGRIDGYSASPLRNVVINEFLAHSDTNLVDYVELYNLSSQRVDISGCILSDDKDIDKFVVPGGTFIEAGNFAVFYQPQLNFGLNTGGETIYFWNPTRTRVLDAVKYEAQALNVSSGRYPNGAADFYPMKNRTPGAANGDILIRDVVINEIMYKPISDDSDDEYIELYNKGTNAVSLAGWRFTAGINYTFQSNVVLAADNYLVVAKNTARLMSNYANLNTNNTFGNYSGTLANRGERVALAMPEVSYTTNGMGQVNTNTSYVVVDEVTYGTGGNWGTWANEGGSSLELIDPRANHRLAYNWADSDESTKSTWTTVQWYGTLDLGASLANLVEVLAMGEGEYLVDNVEVMTGTNGPNLLSAANSNFESGLGNWQLRGTHVRSSLETSGGFGGGQCLHVRASERGDSIVNRATCTITAPAGTATIRAQVRWLKGWPEILLRLHGNFLEAFGRLNIPTNLGTPGQRNSRAVSNGGPAIYQVVHSPIVPAASEVVVVTARVHDPDGVQTVTLNYRVDPAAGYTSVPMLDNGTGGDLVAGDGLYSATIPGQAAGALVAFQVNARDTRGAVTVFPQQIAGNYALPFEALVRFGDPTPFGGFGTYRQWLTAAAINAWASRAALSNEKVYGTFVNGNFRVIYNMTTRWNGSPYHQFGGTPAADGHYTIDLPEDDQMFGTTSFHKIHFPGNGPGDDNTIQREQTCYWFARQLGLPYNYRRNVNMIFNGARRGGTTLMMEDTETPGNDVVNSRFSDDADGDLYKLQPWFEEDVPADPTARTVSPGGGGNSSWCLLNRFTTPSPNGPIYKTARYRNNYLVRAANGTANDYAPVFAMVDAVHTPTNGWAAHTAAIESLIDIEEWTRIWAVCHAVGDWDHVGTQNAQNMYGYKPTHGKWNLMIWDMNIVLGNSGSWGAGVNLVGTYTSGEDTMQTIYANPKFRRMFFRGLKELATGPMVAANVATLLDAKYAAYVASGVTPTSPGAAVKGDIASRVTSILSTVATEDASTFKITGPSSFSTNNNLVTISGEAPVEAATIRINGISYPIIWNSVKAWTIRLAVNAPLNELNIQAYDLRGNLLANFSTNVTVIYNGATIPPPETTLVINEIMYNPAISGAGFVEIYNNSSFAYDLSNWRLNGASYAFPYGSVIAGRQYLVLANDPVAFVSAYGGSAPTFDTFDGSLDNGGETLSLERPTVVGTDTVYVAVNRVEYDDDPPWPASADGFGPSLQLIDANQDNARVSNWSDGGGWRFFSNTGTPSASTTSTICRVYMEIGPSDIYIDDLSVVAGSVPGVGPNFIQNGDFEGPLTTSMGGPWAFSSSLVSNSVIDTTIKHSGNGSLHLIQTGAGAAGHLFQNIAIPPGTYTISYWYLPATNEYRLITYLSSAFRPTNFVKRTFATPGTANSTVAILPPYDRLWLNELQANNLTGPTDNHGEHDPWIELYNAGPGTLDLSGYYLANNFTNLTQWQFSAGTMIAPGEFKIVWADGQPEQTAGTTLHTSFRLGAGGGSLALSRLLSGAPQITDCINYPAVAPDLSYGDFPDGQPIDRQVFFTVTPGTTNSARDVTVFINEWMASNTGTNDNPIADPADGHFDDWFELYNPGNDPIDLKDYYLTDDLADPRQYMIPAGYVVPPHGFLLVWADNDTNQNSTNRPDLHVSFQLSKNGEAIGLFAPNGSTAIDTVTFGPQTNDVSQGRFADGAETIYFMTSPTPGQPNTIGQPNTPPTLAPIPNQTIRLGQTASVTAMGNDVDFPMQTLTYSLDPGFPFGASIDASTGHFLWTPTPSQAPSTNNFTVRVTDNGSPHRSATGGFTVIVRLPPRATISNDGSGHMLIGFDTIAGRTYRVEYKEHLDDPLWNPLGPDVVANGDNLGISDNIGPSPQRFYRIRQVN